MYRIACLVFLFIFISITLQVQAQLQGQAYIDSLTTVLSKATNDSNKVHILNEIAYAYYLIDPQKGIEFAKQELDLAKDIFWDKGTAMAYTSLGTNYWAKADYPSALAQYEKAKHIYQQLDDQRHAATIEMNMGTIFLKQSKYPAALKSYFNSLKIHEKLHDKVNRAIALFNIGNVYNEQTLYKDALNYYNLSEKAFEDLGDKSSLAMVYGNIGTIHYVQHDNNNALFNFYKALTIHEKLGNNVGIAMMNGNIGSIEIIEKKFANGIAHLHKAIELSSVIGDKAGVLTNSIEIGQAYLNLAKDTSITLASVKQAFIPSSKTECLQKAEYYLTNACAIGQETDNLNMLQSAYQYLSETQEALGKYEASLIAYKAYSQLKDSIYSADSTREIVKLEERYKYDTMSAALKAASEKRETIGVSIGIGLVAIGLLSFFFYRRRQADKFEIELNSTKQQALNAQMSDHFIFNAMDSINHFIKENDKEKASAYLVKFSRLVRNVLENAQEKLVPIKQDLAILEDYLDLEKLRFDEDMFQYKILINENIDANNTLIPPMIFQTLAENSIKHGFRRRQGGLLKIHVERKKDQIVCSIEDNGKGRDNLKSTIATDGKRISHGNRLAEKLVKAVSKYGKNTSYQIIDMFDAQNFPIGTRVQFSIPYLSE